MIDWDHSRATNTPNLSKPIPASPGHHPTLRTHPGLVKASQTTQFDQVLLQDQQHCSRSIKTSPGNFILVPTTPAHHRHHPDPPWTSQSLPEQLWLTKFTTLPQTLLQVHSNPSWLLHAYHSQSINTITPELPQTWQSLWDHSKQQGHSPGLPALFQTNHKLPWLFRTYPAI